jgi:malate dehydrogenase
MCVNKITVVGAGHVGATCAHLLALKEMAREVVIVDILEGVPMGKALDQWESAPVEGYDTMITGANDYESSAGSDMFIITAGVPRKPGMSRDDLLSINAGIVKSVSHEIKRVAPDSIIIMVSNPLDVMAFVAKEETGFPRERVIGMAGVLDTARFRSFLAMELDVSVEDIQAMVLGGHGDSMVPITSTASISGIPLTYFVDGEPLEAIVNRTRKGGGEIVGLLKTGSAYYAPAAGAVQMAEAIIKNKRRILPSSAYLQGEFGLNDIYIGVPCKLGEGGLQEVVELKLSDAEQEALTSSAAAVQSTIEDLRNLDY